MEKPLSRIKRIDEKYLEGISEYHRIIGFRNILIHGYDSINELIVWNAVEKHLPILKQEIQKMIDES